MKKFDKDSYLRKLKIKRWIQSYSRYLYIGVSCLFVCIIGNYFAYSKFFVKQEMEVVRTTVGEFTNGDIVLNIYVDNEKVEEATKKDDWYYVYSVSCNNNAEAVWDSDNWSLLVTKLTGKTKCDIYFKKIESKVPDIIAQLDTTSKCPTVNADGAVKVTAVEATNSYLCKAKDAYGDSYYFRGNVTNNYVKFAGFYWRIVRINGDRSVRVIYDGTVAHANGEASADKKIGTSAFNSSSNDNAYVGYMYGATKASTYNEAHANTNDSKIKIYVDKWYKSNILDTMNEKYLINNIFCNDRSISSNKPSSSYNNLGYGKNATAYRWHYGPWSSGNYNDNVKLTCPQQEDAFTVSDTINGNGALTYPIGLLSDDEMVLAGGWNGSNSGYYLYSGQYWCTSSPVEYMGAALIRRMVQNSVAPGVASGSVKTDSSNGVRPVINIKAEALKNGDGTMDNPYEP